MPTAETQFLYTEPLIEERSLRTIMESFGGFAMGIEDGATLGTLMEQSAGNVFTDPIIHGGQFYGVQFTSSSRGGRVEIFPDPTRGISCWNNEATPYRVFEVMVAGTNVGDVTLGNYSGGAGAQWDQSAETFTVSGSLVASDIHIPDTTTANSFHVNTGGNMWLGTTVALFNADNNNANAYILNTGVARFASVTVTSASSSVTGGAVVGGWTAGTGDLTAGTTNVVIDATNRAISINSATFGTDGIQLEYNAGNPRMYVGDGASQFFQFDGTNISWDGSVSSLDTAGLFTTTSALIGGWNVVTGFIYNLQSGTPTAAPNDGVVLASGNEGLIVYEDTEERARVGFLSAGVYGFRAFATNGTTVIFEASDTRQVLGGWNFTDTVLRSGATDAASNVLIDSANSLLRLGPTTGDFITLDGANQRMRSSTYSTGVSGFTVEPNLVEAQNIIARGTLSGSVFRYDVISATGGRQVIANADALSTAMTALDASTLTVRGNATFAVNDILVIRAQSSGGIQEEYLRVTGIGVAPTYTVTRDLLGTYAADANPAWAAGTAVVQHGESDGAAAFSGGWLDLVGEASSGNFPRISVFQRTGVGATAFTERVRMGNLNGYLGYVADTYGFACGSSAGTDANITIDPTNGIRIRNGTTNVITLDNAGNVTVNTITATAGTIAAFTIAATTISATNLTLTSGAANTANIAVGTGANLAGMNSANAAGDITFWCGDTFANRATAPFRTTAAGALTATNATITGTITATAGAIAAFTIAATTISATNLTFTSGAANTANITVGTGATAGGLNSAAAGGDIIFWGGDTFANRATAPFRVTAAGALTATSATISGTITATAGAIAAFTIAATTISATNLVLTSGAANTANITVGTGATAGGINSANAAGDIIFWGGSAFADRATAPFRVDAAGNVFASTVRQSVVTVADTQNFIGTDITQNDVTNNPIGFRVTQNTTGDIINFFDGATEVFTILDGGAVGFNNAAPTARLDLISTGTTTHGINAVADSLTTGSVGRFYSNSADTSARFIANLVNDNALATGAVTLGLQQDGGNAHIRMIGDPANSSPTDGDFWFSGSRLRFTNGAVTGDLGNMVTGTYTGDAVDARVLSLGVNPRKLVIHRNSGNVAEMCSIVSNGSTQGGDVNTAGVQTTIGGGANMVDGLCDGAGALDPAGTNVRLGSGGEGMNINLATYIWVAFF